MHAEQIAHYHRHLLDWYSKNQRPLPWRRTGDPYAIWVSEVMLQQTQVKTVIPYYLRFMHNWPDVAHLARAELQTVLKSWEGLGYYARARNLHRAAARIAEQFAGRIPDAWQQLRGLPGVGDYIASAVLSIAYGQPYAVVDGNVKRVLSRLLRLDVPINHRNSKRVFGEAADRLLDSKRPGTYNQALMELGAVVCVPRQPDCPACAVNCLCEAFAAAVVEDYPRREPRRQAPLYHIAVGIVFRKSRVLITQRKMDGLLGGLWEFPGGKIRDGESPQEACVREIKEEVNLVVQPPNFLARVKHAYTHFRIIMEVFCCSYVSGRVRLDGPIDYRWIQLEELDHYPLPKANHKFIPKLREMVSDCGLRIQKAKGIGHGAKRSRAAGDE
jgi:A/G-specific adenine glycosylase